MPALSRVPPVPSLHRLMMFCIKRSGKNSDRLFDLYRRAWVRAGRFQKRVADSGAIVECDLLDRIPEFIFHFGHWEPNLSFWIAQRLQPGNLFVDVGSNLGYYSLLASRIVGPSGGVIAIEASPRIFAQLQRGIESNGCRNIRSVNVAVADTPGTVTIYAGPAINSGATSTLAHWRNGNAEAEVAALPLDEILTQNELARVRLIKIDVEGAEAPILRQIAESIHKYAHNVEILVECSSGADEATWRSIFERFASEGFRAFRIDNEYSAAWYLRWRSPCELTCITGVPSGQTDVLFTRDPSLPNR